MTRGVNSSLHVPDDLRWHDDKAYSPVVAAALRQAYAEIKRSIPRSKGYLAARVQILRYRRRPMSKRQQMLVDFVLAMASGAERAYQEGLHYLDEALTIARELGDRGAFAELAYLHGSMDRASCHITAAAVYHTICLTTLWSLGETNDRGGSEPPQADVEVGSGPRAADDLRAVDQDDDFDAAENEPIDAALELSALVDLAGSEAMRGDFGRAEWCLLEARPLTRWAPECRLEIGMIPWLHALLSRWQGDLSHALTYAMQACDAYTQAAAGSPAAQGRIHTVVADIALDLAEDSAVGAPYFARTAFLKLAAPYVRKGVDLAREGADASGEGLALLTKARYDRLSDRQVDRLRSIDEVVRLARAMQDAPLSSQAYVALGKELAAQGWDVDMQINCYDKGQQVLADSDVRAIARLAHREALRARELRDRQ